MLCRFNIVLFAFIVEICYELNLELMIKYALLFFIALLSTVVHAQFEAPDYKPDLWMTNGQVEEVIRNANTVYIGGLFSYVGPRTGSGVSVSTTTGEFLTCLHSGIDEVILG